MMSVLAFEPDLNHLHDMIAFKRFKDQLVYCNQVFQNDILFDGTLDSITFTFTS